MSVLEVRALKVHLAGRTVVDVDFTLAQGETLALLGESGCGKSMTALALMRLLPEGATMEGSVRLDGVELLQLPDEEMKKYRGSTLAMIFQEPGTSLNPVMTVEGHLLEALATRFLDNKNLNQKQKTDECLRLLKAMGMGDEQHRLSAYPFELSGGLKQRAMIAVALAGAPQILLADEPTTALDVTVQMQVLDLLKKMQAQMNMGMLLITHDVGVVAKMAHRVCVMYAGVLVEEGSCAEVLKKPLHPYTRMLMAVAPDFDRLQQPLPMMEGQVSAAPLVGCVFAPRCSWVTDKCREKSPAWIARDGGSRGARCIRLDEKFDLAPPLSQFSAASTVTAEPLLRVRDLRFSYPVRQGKLFKKKKFIHAVNGVSLTINRGQTLALVGESGCGKTTLGRVLLRLVGPATAGEVRLDGEDVLAAKGDQLKALRAQMQMVFQDPHTSLNPRHRVGEIIAEGIRTLGRMKENEIEQKVKEALTSVGLSAEAIDLYPHQFSGGQRQRIAIARALAVNPRFIVCDEPTSALDVSIQSQILSLLRELQNQRRLTYLFITHNLTVAGFFAQKIAVMYLGQIVEMGDIRVVLYHPSHPYTQALVAALPRLSETSTMTLLSGEPPSAFEVGPGCSFYGRCKRAMPRCHEEDPPQTELADGQMVRCFLYCQ